MGFYGGAGAVLARMVTVAKQRYPRLDVVYAEAPPFRELTPEEDRRTMQAMQDAGVRILFVGLGSPKQDRWMHAHKDRVQAVMLGVGAAFDFLAGAKPQAPHWMQSSGLEWAFRLASEPRRLWRRYLTQNPKFVVLAVAQISEGARRYEHGCPARARASIRSRRAMGAVGHPRHGRAGDRDRVSARLGLAAPGCALVPA